ncbi:MAG: membrane protein insertase YidC [Hamadaea sp.]|nr:membrane protein insertase YidC [Hamadaea sp.]NUR47088.1 membrane protein insertase YidC [Hamadaea sp.]NUT07379.1 membrane protein insertase YidC [Hamadaea sp.]
MHPIDSAAQAAQNLLVHLAALLTPVGGTAAAIVLATVLLRLALHPLTRSAVRTERAKAALAPKLAPLRKKYADDPTTLMEKTLELHRVEGISPFAGFLPLLAQTPFFIVLFHLYNSSTIGGRPNALLSDTLFGAPLSARFLAQFSALGVSIWIFAGLFAALASVAWLMSRRSARLLSLADPPPTGLLAALPRVLPFTVLISAIWLPLAAVLALLTTTAWTAAENTLLKRGMPTAPPARR